MILLIDNYDSFVFNLARYVVELGFETQVVRNDAISVEEIRGLNPEAVILSPGPCTPNEAGICVDLVRELSDELPLLGVCLGHQAIAAAFGAGIIRAPEPVHGRTSLITHDDSPLFDDVPNPCRVTRYHSLVVDESSLPDSLHVTARTNDGLIMAFEDRVRPVFGVQFHPEAVLTQSGHRLLANFLTAAGLQVNGEPEPAKLGDALGSEGIGPEIATAFTDATSHDWPATDSHGGTLHW
ncbi:aminodeoxychorismate/anthranilate synthase component II [bacterium]|nr:aminodeoxychorismate/anthranilate synthase component II [bacterium]